MKRIALSLATIAAVVTLSVASTGAYFSDTKVAYNNTFATGTVTLADVSGASLTVTNLVPGIPQTFDRSIGYVGSANADLYMGNRGYSAPADNNYIADKLWVTIYDKDGWAVKYNGWANGLATSWTQIASNVTQNTTKDYRMVFTLDNSFTNQTVNNTDTQILFYAVQTNGPVPATPPYLTW